MAWRRLADTLGVRLRHVLAGALDHSDFQELLLSIPRLRPSAASRAMHGSLADALHPHRRWLWRQRSLVLLARGVLAASSYVVVAHFLLARLLPSAPDLAVWAPALFFLFAGIWLCIANKPSIQETAYWLDHRFELHEQLGTALEQDPNANEHSLAGRQVARAMDLAGRLPARPMDVRQQGPWALAVAVALVGVLSVVIPGQTTSGVESASSAVPSQNTSIRSPGPVARATSGQRLAVRAPLKVAPALPHGGARTGIHAVATSQPLLSSSLQIRLGPSSGNAATQDTTGAALQVAHLNGAASSKSTKAARQPPASGNSGKSQRPAGSSQSSPASPQGSSQKGGNSGTGQGQHGPNANSNQPQQGVQQQLDNGAQGSPSQAPPRSPAGSQISQGQNQTQSHSGRQSSQASGQQRGSSQANPFGVDPSAPKNKSGQTPPGNSTKTVKPGGSGTSPGQRGSAGAQQGTGGGNSADNSPDGRPYNRSGSSLPSSPNSPQTGGGKSSGPTHTTTIEVQGKATIGSGGGQGPDLVRVMPYGAEPGEALQGPSGGGSGTVEGYVPEQTFMLSPDEQALVQAYFGNGTGS